MRSFARYALAAALLFAACAGGSVTGDPQPAGDPYPHAFGVFAALAPEFGEFSRAMGFDDTAYREWAGDRMNELGARWSRSNLQLVWDLVEPTVGGDFDWGASFDGEAVYGAASAHGVAYLGVFHEGGTGSTNGTKPSLRDPLADLAAYQRFVTASVEHYDGDGVADAESGAVIKYWQIGNEAPGFLLGGHDSEDYVTWFKATAAAIRAADPEARLVLTASTDATRMDPLHRAVIPRLAADGVRFDAIDLHHWGSASLAAAEMSAVPEYQAALAAAGLTDVELWSCEHGTYVGTPAVTTGSCSPACAGSEVCSPLGRCSQRCTQDASCPSLKPHCDVTSGLCTDAPQTHEDQARALVYRYVVNRALGVKRIMWNNLVGWRCFGTCGAYYDLMGLVSDGYGPAPENASYVGRKRPSFYTYQLLASRTEADVAEQLGKIENADATVHVYGYRKLAGGALGLVAWAEAPTTATLDFVAAHADVTGLVTDWDGTPLRGESVATVAGRLTVLLDPNPVWIASRD